MYKEFGGIMLWLLLGCQESTTSNQFSEPIVQTPISTTSTTTPTFRATLPSDWKDGFVALSVKNQYNQEVRYIVRDAKSDLSITLEEPLTSNESYCWNIQYFVGSRNQTFDGACFTIGTNAVVSADN